ncbi:MAG: hypothetical protein JSS66_06790 [Armatimonadetes bacterium]|nr:hypothetical protein [Armatimonadota bacterium]
MPDIQVAPADRFAVLARPPAGLEDLAGGRETPRPQTNARRPRPVAERTERTRAPGANTNDITSTVGAYLNLTYCTTGTVTVSNLYITGTTDTAQICTNTVTTGTTTCVYYADDLDNMRERFLTDHSTWVFASMANSGQREDPVQAWERQEKAKQAEYEKKLAAHKAVHLLFSLIDDAQQQMLLDKGYFELDGADGHRYRLIYHRHGNVARLDRRGKVTHCWCGHYGEDIPVADTLVAQRLVLEFDPQQYLVGANPVSQLSWCKPFDNYKDVLREALAGAPEMPVPEPKPDLTPPIVTEEEELVAAV